MAAAASARNAAHAVPLPGSDPVMGRVAGVRVGLADGDGEAVAGAAVPDGVGLAVGLGVGDGDGVGEGVTGTHSLVAVSHSSEKMQAWIVSEPVPPAPV